MSDSILVIVGTAGGALVGMAFLALACGIKNAIHYRKFRRHFDGE